MESRQPLKKGPLHAPPSLGSSTVPLYVPPPAAWRPSMLVHRPLVKVKRPSRIPSYLCWLVVLSAMVTGAWYYQLLDLVNPNSPRATAKAFMGAIDSGDMAKMQQLCTAATQPLLAPLKQAANRTQSRSTTEYPKEFSWRATAVEVISDRAIVTITQTFTHEKSVQSSELPLTLVQENGKWKVDLIDGPDGGYETVKGLSGQVEWR